LNACEQNNFRKNVMFKNFLARSFVFATVLGIGTSFASADTVIRQTGQFPSFIDLSNGQSDSDDSDKDRDEAVSQTAGVGTPSSLATSTRPPKTQQVSGYLRKNGTYVHSYVRSSRR
jgi:hypothetical protein